LGEFTEMKKMGISVDCSALTTTKWYEFALRFLFGGAVTVGTGIVAKKYGPSVGGLFLAFPAIFPSAITLVEKHERQKKRNAGLVDMDRGRKAAALDAAGAAMGSVGLAGFGYTVYKCLPLVNGAVVLTVASIIWFAISAVMWKLRKTHHWF
jgi:hypothetical protein